MSSLKKYVNLWLCLSAILAYEFAAINFFPSLSILHTLQIYFGGLPTLKLTTQAGKRISLWLGWTGFGLMFLTNAYVVRKRLGFLQNLGNLPRWLDFHIFCGLMGPTLILLHTNFKIGGLVALSFWSMVISFTSGVVGRYLYMQMSTSKRELEQLAESSKNRLIQVVNPELVEKLRAQALRVAGVRGDAQEISILQSVINSMTGDIRLRLKFMTLAAEIPMGSRESLRTHIIATRRSLYLKQFQALMGYWHSFHMPFAVLMYLIAVVHITTALLMKAF